MKIDDERHRYRSHLIEEVKKKIEAREKKGMNGEGLPFENSPEIYGNKRMEAYRKGYNTALTDLIADVEKI